MAWWDGANLKAHISSRAFPREIPVRGCFFFSNGVFNHFLLEDSSQTNGNRLVGAPRAHFRQKLKIDKQPELLLYSKGRVNRERELIEEESLCRHDVLRGGITQEEVKPLWGLCLKYKLEKFGNLQERLLSEKKSTLAYFNFTLSESICLTVMKRKIKFKSVWHTAALR